MTVIHRGTLTLEKLKELAALHYVPVNSVISDDHTYNPAKNHNAISIIKQPDGNYKGSMWKNEMVIEARGIDPQTVVTMLLTHS